MCVAKNSSLKKQKAKTDFEGAKTEAKTSMEKLAQTHLESKWHEFSPLHLNPPPPHTENCAEIKRSRTKSTAASAQTANSPNIVETFGIDQN